MPLQRNITNISAGSWPQTHPGQGETRPPPPFWPLWPLTHFLEWIVGLAIIIIVSVLFSSLPIGAFQWPITSSVTLTFNLNYLFLQQLRFTSVAVFILTHSVNFSVGGNRSARRKPTTFGRVLTDSFHMSGALGSSNIEKVLSENRTRNLRGERRVLWPLRHLI